jgi:hypothetical protein
MAHPPLGGVGSEPEGQQLPARDHTPLPVRDFRDARVNGGELSLYSGYNSRWSGHGAIVVPPMCPGTVGVLRDALDERARVGQNLVPIRLVEDLVAGAGVDLLLDRGATRPQRVDPGTCLGL